MTVAPFNLCRPYPLRPPLSAANADAMLAFAAWRLHVSGMGGPIWRAPLLATDTGLPHWYRAALLGDGCLAVFDRTGQRVALSNPLFDLRKLVDAIKA